MQGYIFPYIPGRSSPNKYINKNFWGGSGQDKSIQKFQGGALIMGLHGSMWSENKGPINQPTKYGRMADGTQPYWTLAIADYYRY